MFQSHLGVINDLVFLSISHLLLLDIFEGMKIKCVFKIKKFLDFQANFSTQRALNSKSVLQEDVTFGGQSHLKLLAKVPKNLFFHL